jgi:hypothetical protein
MDERARYIPSQNPAIFLAASESQSRTQAALSDIDNFPPMHEIVPNVWLGTQRAAGIIMPFEARDPHLGPRLKADYLTRLRSHNITTIICCSENDPTRARPYVNEGITYHHKELMDGGLYRCDEKEFKAANDEFATFFATAFKLMREALSNGGAVLVHCNSGANRSSSVVCGYLMLTLHKKLDAILPMVGLC